MTITHGKGKGVGHGQSRGTGVGSKDGLASNKDLLEEISRLRSQMDNILVQVKGDEKSGKADVADAHESDIGPIDLTKEYIKFTNEAPTVYHAVNYIANKLEAQGFVKLSERTAYSEALFATESDDKFYVTRNGSSLVAFVIGSKWKPGNGAAIIASHIDSLAGKVKPISKKDPVDGFTQIGVAPYAGAFSSTWWDRDLGLGGRVVVKHEDGTISSELVHIPYPVARIPTLAPHFGAPSQGPFDKETNMTPIIGLVGDHPEDDEPTEEEKKSPLVGKHSIRLLRKVASEIGYSVSSLIQMDLEMFDTHAATIGGLDGEFLFAPRIDDKICSYGAAQALIESSSALSDSSSLGVIAMFDDEEVGSLVRQGANGGGGGLLGSTLERILSAFGSKGDDVKRLTYANSFLISADVSHAVNPNFSNFYLENHKPHLNVGLAIGFDPNAHMTTTAESAAFVEDIARETGDILQCKYFNDRESQDPLVIQLLTQIFKSEMELHLEVLLDLCCHLPLVSELLTWELSS